MADAPSAAPAFFPLDEQLALLPGKLTPQLHGWLVRLSSWMPFARAAQLLTDFTLVPVSEATARRLSESAGSSYVVLQTEEAARIQRDDPEAPAQPARLVLSADGAMVPLLHGEWAEVKTLAIGEPTADGCMSLLSYFSRLTDAATFGEQALVEVHRRGVLRTPLVAAVTDGAEWLQGFVDLHAQQAVRILDFAHVAQRVSALGQLLYGEGSAEARAWLPLQLQRLKEQGAVEVLSEMRRQQAGHAKSSELEPHLVYLEKRQKQMEYGAFVAGGWPIGSGMVESANKLVVEARLKGSGMHWAREHVNSMLALRNLEGSERWEEGWGQMQARRRRVAGARREARLACEQAAEREAQRVRLRSAAPQVVGTLPPSVPGGRARPGASHPWRRAVQPHMRDRQPTVPHPTKL